MSDPNFPPNLNIRPLQVDAIDSFKQKEGIEKYGIAGRIWEAGQPLLEYLTAGQTKFDPPCSIFSESLDKPYRIIELGSGQSLPSLHLATHISSNDLLVLTDLPNVIPLCEQSILTWMKNLNGVRDHAKVLARPMAWGGDISHLKEFEPWSHILMCDLIYFPNLYPPLLRTLLQLTEPETPVEERKETFGPEIILSYKSRSLSLEESFFDSLSHYFKCTPVIGGDREVRIYICQRWRITSDWTLPDIGSVMNGGKGVVRGRDFGLVDELFAELEW